jgi:hypothetical protein
MDLGEFAAAAGQTVQAPQTNLEKLGAPPQAPSMSPGYAAAQSDLRAKSAVTPKVDPTTGQTLPQYKPSMGARIGRAFLDSARGFIRGGLPGAISGPLEGAFGDKSSPGYYGAGAVSGQYFKDEAARQRGAAADTAQIKSFEDENNRARDEFKDKSGVWKDQFDVAKNQDISDLKQQNVDERTAHNEATEDLKKKLQDATTPEAKETAILNARTKIADKLQLAGDDRKLYLANGKLPDDPTLARRLAMEEKRLGMEQQRLDIEKTRAAGKGLAATFKDQAAIDKYSDQWYQKQRDQVRKDKTEAFKNAGGGKVDDALRAEYKTIEDGYNQRTTEFENRKQQWSSQVKSGKPVSVKEPEGGGIPDVQSDTGIAVPASTDSQGRPLAAIPNAAAPVRPGQPVQGIEAHNNDGSPATATVTGTDGKGRPTIGVQPSAQPQITPISDKQHKTPGGRVYNVGDKVNGQTIKGFVKDKDGKVRAAF